MSSLIILATDSNYVNHVKYLVNNIRDKGNEYDICVIFKEEEKEFIESSLSNLDVIFHPIKVKQENSGPFLIKYHIFESFYKKWKKVLYLDCDTMVYGKLDKLFDLINEENKMIVDYEGSTIKDFFTMWTEKNESNSTQFEILNQEELINVNQYGFNGGILLFSTDLIEENTINRLYDLHEKYKLINNHGQGHAGEQPIVNILMGRHCSQVPNNFFCFWRSTSSDTLISHFCRWEAPWHNYHGHPNLPEGHNFNTYYNKMLNLTP
jgi:lipopolysaccharide biosynthesis glycosyltransferase